ncbi:MAG: bifunctional riboflavin kinase/FAD synthetase [Desulfamplus sp.]|nr:bifunctional riboflavin kinase/FAD synthetase [Desulfamplus sp.]MBF0257729.1 bifunctional riboflavin kinase/FAD synthetase [Desulfamplus sp.]
MELIEDIDKIEKPFKNAVVTIGNFDGVHRGHQALFAKVMEESDAISGTSIAITFEPHPLRALGKKAPPLITRKDQKVELISAAGLDKLICIPFTKEFAAISAQDFIDHLLIDKIGMKTIVVGPDYSFGKNREGSIDFLFSAGEDKGFKVIVPDWVNDPEANNGSEKDRISSTMIRNLVMDGRVDETKRFLGRHYQIRGKVVKGRERGGRKLGFPTANIKLHDELCPKMGVYAVTVETVKGNFKAVANIGYSPTFDDHLFTIEVHILDFSADIYGTRIRVNMIKRLRDEKKFASIEELSNQIRSDIETARTILK